MANPPPAQSGLFADAPFAFADRFLQDHAGQIISEPRTAILELIANSYDAGATKIDLVWPNEKGQKFSVTDDGIGMTKAEFERRWRTLCYDREAEQGNAVVFPKGVRGIKRTAFGRSGKGRHAPFCFADSYEIATMKDGDLIQVRVGLASSGTTPFEITLLAESKKRGHGTEISAVLEKHLLGVDELKQLIGSKFIVDPSLCIRVNQQSVELMSLEGLKTTEIIVEGHGAVTIHFIDSIEHYRSARLRGISWWVNQRRVGEPNWDRLDDEGAYLDGRTEHAKKFSFIVMADFLTPGQDVKADWSDFHANQRTNAVRDAVHRYVIKEIQAQLATTRKERKKSAIENSRELMGELPTISKNTIGQFIDEVQEKCPTMSDRDLSRTVQVLAKLEQSRSGYDLLTQLAACSPDDLDTWNSLMQRWTASNAEIVLDELDRRLKLIGRMEKLVENPLADELHDLQPLFERGLWIFGPEFESVDFRSNRGLAEVIGRFLGGADYKPPKRRPDFVALPESTIGAYCADAYDTGGEICGIRKVAILELKKGGYCVTQKEADQARDYAKEIRKAGRVQAATEIVAYVLGATLEDGLESADYGDTTHIIPMIYQTVLRKAHQRTFNLQKRLLEALPSLASDPEVDEVLRVDAQQKLFDGSVPKHHMPTPNGVDRPAPATVEPGGGA
ncbi:ATP-binding protein [Urbifossiella limnaea]|uniref:DNA mismatch repair protein n=1 Tax=Urbifossiella limnaea TaxID=2528023 RepID=A0A517XW67_9BACT|nr:ATP-binding protein [Urbifossiella limnaea]QDU21714.1 DNA mismatch repair protein [Urbifossiella limnaea]